MEWKSLFPTVVYMGAKNLYNNGGVINLSDEKKSNSEGEISADVKGVETFKVKIRYTNDVVYSISCSCPLSNGKNPCKHIAATMIAWEDSKLEEKLEELVPSEDEKQQVEPSKEVLVDTSVPSTFVDGSNFEFMMSYWPDMAEIGATAENYLYSDPNACIFKLGLLGERIVSEIIKIEGIIIESEDTQANKIKVLKREGLIPYNIDDILFALRKARNDAVHEGEGSFDKAKTLLRMAYNLSVWFMEVYGDWSFKASDYVEPVEKAYSDDVIDKLKEQDLRIDALLEQITEIKTKASEASKEDRSIKAEEVSENIPLTESENEYLLKEQVRLNISSLPVVNYALQQNGKPLITSISIENKSNEELTDVELKITSEPEVCEIYSKHIESAPGNSVIELQDVEPELNGEFLASLTEKIKGRLIFELSVNGEVFYKENADITVLAFDEWNGYLYYPEVLASFVTPNHPDIVKITSKAADYLGKWTGDPSLDAYQSMDVNRVLSEVAAVYEATKAENIVYSVPPASFEKVGQRVRLCDAILEQKMGTCLDLTLLCASCLEAIGLHPILLLKKGHIFAGAWLEDNSFPETIQDDISFVTKRLAEGLNELVVFECTALTSGRNMSFDDAVASAKKQLIDVNSFEFILDVSRARLSGVAPIPQRIKTEAGYKVIRPENTKGHFAPSSVLGPVDTDVELTPQTRIDRWERKLLDLGLRNGLINMRLGKSTVPILASSLDELENSLASGNDFTISSRPVDWHLSGPLNFDTIHELGGYEELVKSEFKNKRLRSIYTEAELTKATKDLYRASRVSLEENGANTLYLALGLLRWYETPRSVKARYAPLIMLPIEMVRKSVSEGYVIRLRDDEPQMNITILEKLKQDFKINIEGLDPLPEDEQGIDTRKVFTIMRKAIMNQDRWDILESAYLGIFSFTQFVMWNDLRNRTEDLAKNKVVKSLMNGKIEWAVEEMEIGEKISEENVLLPIPADASQLFAIDSAAKGQSFVLHGPPGTGKSQTITALIANALAKGKTVLFVAEKMAALQVVQSRLEKIGIGDFCLELHSNKSKKKDVLEQLKKASEVTKKVTSESYKVKAEQISKMRSELDEYVSKLHETQSCGVSLFELINEYEENKTDVELTHFDKEVLDSMTRDKIDELSILVQRLIAAAKSVGHPSKHPLEMIGCDAYSQKLRVDMPDVTNKYLMAVSKLKECQETVNASLGLNYTTYRELEKLGMVCSELLKWYKFPEAWGGVKNTAFYFDQVKEMAGHFSKKNALKDKLLKDWKEDFLDVSSDALFSEYQVCSAKWALPKALGINNISKRLVIYSNTAKVDKANLGNTLLDLVSYQKELTEGKSLLNQYGADLGNFYEGDNTDWNNIVKLAEEAKQSVEQFAKIGTNESLRITFCGKEEIRDSLINYCNAWVVFNGAYNEFNNLLSIEDDDKMGWLDAQFDLCNAINKNYDDIKEWITWVGISKEAISKGLLPVVKAYKQGLEHEKVYVAYKHAICKELAVKLIDENAALNKFSGSVFNEKISQFKKMDAELTRLTQLEIYCRLAANVPNFTKEAAQSSELGILQRAIRSNGRGVSIRKLFEQIPNLLPRLCPCMLMSPISAAQYLDPKSELFDLVVFDEASQLPTCKAVGALARGENAIVVGDPNQMPPTSFFSTTAVDEDNIEMEDLESILDDCLAMSMPQTHLLWHYRSKHESLIAFSNSHFYGNKLYTFPSVNDRETKVSLVHVNGTFERGKTRHNKEEARAVVDEILRRFNDEILRRYSIGVVTFNSAQQNLIDDLLSAECENNQELEAWVYNEKEPIFIKNLENVQGDERDVILFSVGYGPDEYGKISLNFGPLNREGGWRRLNVAVSRARCEMTVFSTLTPENIDVNRTSAKGVLELKHFLEYAAGQKLICTEENVDTMGSHSINGIVKTICEELKANGYDTDVNIGHSENRIDIGIVDPNNSDSYILGILLDGHGYEIAKTTRDREIAQVGILESLGWNILRIWTMDWWDNSKKEIKRIFDCLKKIEDGEEEETKEEPAKTTEPDIEEMFALINDSVESMQKVSRVIPTYKTARLKQSNVDPEDFAKYNYTSSIRERAEKVIEEEAPIFEAVLVRRIAQSFGFARAGSRIQAKIMPVLKAYSNQVSLLDGKKMYWKKNQNPKNFYCMRANGEGENQRYIAEVPLPELKNAVGYVLYEQVGLNQEDLIREAAKILNYTRKGNVVTSTFEEAIDATARLGLIELGANDCWKLTDTGMWWAKEIEKALSD